MDKKIIRLLIIDDSPDDAELAVTTLRKSSYMLKTQRVQDLAGCQAALEKAQWEVVISEYSLAHMGAALALDLLKRLNIDIPLLVFTRAIKDPDLVKIMRMGARDVILKNQPVRLGPVIERELRVAEERRLYREAVQARNETETKHKAIIEGSREAICYSQDGMHVNANKAYLELFEYDNVGELEGIPVMNLIDKSDHPRFKEFIRKSGNQGAATPVEFLAIKKDGTRFHAEVALSPIVLDNEQCTQILFTDVSKRKAVESKLKYLNQHDPLTGLLNRHYFTQELNHQIDKNKREGIVSGLIYIDFHDLKNVNSMHGHAAGDRFLLKVVRLLRDQLGDATMLSRLGDNEFAVLMRDADAARLKESTAALEKALKETAFSEGGKAIKCDFAISAMSLDKNVENATKVLLQVYQSCDQARPKQAPAPPPAASAAPAATAPSKEPIAQTKPAVTAQAPTGDPGPWRERLDKALKENEFQLSYQPVINLHGDATECFEVLVRLPGEKNETISAGKFMGPAVLTGQSVALDRWVVRHSLEALADLRREGREPLFFINLCASVYNDAEILPLIIDGLRKFNLKAGSLVFEIDESAVVAQAKEAGTFIRAAKKIGCAVCIDNFGRSLGDVSHLRELPIDYLKLDGSLVRNLQDTISQASLKAVVELAKAMNKKTIAKNVESADSLSVLWNLGLDYVQGNYFQQADAQLDYEFAGETTLSSDVSAPQWASKNGKKR